MKGWQALQLVEIARLPHRPSDLLEMRQAGYGPEACLAFDYGAISFVNRFERLREETVEKPVSPSRQKRKPTERVPKHDEAALLKFLGVDPEDEGAAEFVANYDPERAALEIERDLGAMDWGEDDAGPD